MRVIASSDWHLDQATAGIDRFIDICGSIDVSVQHAISAPVDVTMAVAIGASIADSVGAKADMYLFCGDLCDPNTSMAHRAIAKAVEVQRRCHEAGILFVAIAGNHDVIEDGSGVTTLRALGQTGRGILFEKPTVSYAFGSQCTLIALPFTAQSHDYDPDKFIRGLDIPKEHPVLIMGHLNLEGIAPGSETTEMPRGRNVYWPTEAIAECFPDAMVVGGHYHKPQEYGGVRIIGSLARMRFDEADNDLGFMTLEI